MNSDNIETLNLLSRFISKIQINLFSSFRLLKWKNLMIVYAYYWPPPNTWHIRVKQNHNELSGVENSYHISDLKEKCGNHINLKTMLSLFGYLLNCNISKIYFKAKIDNIILEWGVSIAPPPPPNLSVWTLNFPL